MATMGKYCKAYSIKKLREFRGWAEKAQNARQEKQKDANGKEAEVTRILTDNDYLYIQENYVVTDGIFKDDNVIFDQVTPEWIAYCRETLKFEIPSFASTGTTPIDSTA